MNYPHHSKPPLSFCLLGILIVTSVLTTAVLHQRAAEKNEIQLSEARNLARVWLVNNLKPEGYFRYEYPESDHGPGNHIRQIIASISLAKMTSSTPELLPLHSKNLEYIFSYWYHQDTSGGYMLDGEVSNVGENATALWLLSVSPLFKQYEIQAAELAKTIISTQRIDGSFKPFFKSPEGFLEHRGNWYSIPSCITPEDYVMAFHGGKTIIALVKYYEKTGDTDALNAANKSAGYYIHHFVDNMDSCFYPVYVPWLTQGLFLLDSLQPNIEYQKAIFKMNDRLIQIQNTSGYPTTEYRGSFYDPQHPEYGPLESAFTAAYKEGLTYALELANKTQDKKRVRIYKQSINLADSYLLSLQEKNPSRAGFGGIELNAFNSIIRVDTVAHFWLGSFERN